MKSRKLYEKVLNEYFLFVRVGKICKVLWIIVSIGLLGILIGIMEQNEPVIAWSGLFSVGLPFINFLIYDFYLPSQKKKILHFITRILRKNPEQLSLSEKRQLLLIQEELQA